MLDPRVFAAIDEFRQDMMYAEGVPDITRQPDGTIDILALDEMVFAAQGASLDSTPFEAAGWRPTRTARHELPTGRFRTAGGHQRP